MGGRMGRWLAPLVGVVGLLALVAGLVWVELDRGSTGGVAVVGAGVAGLVVACLIAAVVETHERRSLSHR